MQSINISQITENLAKLPADKLAVVYDFVSYLTERETGQSQHKTRIPDVMLLSKSEYEQLLRYKQLFELQDFARQLGQEIEKRGLTEVELMDGLKETKREVFEELYGQI